MIKTFFTVILLGVFFYAVYWFVSFQRSPYTHCIDHPDKELTDSYYLCEPGDFEVPKGLLEKSAPTPWLKEQSEERKRRNREAKKRSQQEKEQQERLDATPYLNNYHD